MPKLTPLFLFGGTSNERRVSVASAQNVNRFFPGAACMYMAPDGKIFETSAEELARHTKPFVEDFLPSSAPRYTQLSQALDDPAARAFVFILCFHGGDGENGVYQREFEARRIPFTGSGSAASALAMDKGRAKVVAKDAGLFIADGITLPAARLAESDKLLTEMFQKSGPVIVKPLGGGSTLGVHFIREEKQIGPASIAMRSAEPDNYIVEALLSGRELTVGVADLGGGLRPLPPSEVIVDPQREFDFEGKYLGKGVLEVTPAKIEPALTEAVQQAALKIHLALGCEGYSRTDFIAVGERAYYLETNTLPGLSAASFVPQQLAAAGIAMKDFLDAQISLACRRAGLSG